MQATPGARQESQSGLFQKGSTADMGVPIKDSFDTQQLHAESIAPAEGATGVSSGFQKQSTPLANIPDPLSHTSATLPYAAGPGSQAAPSGPGDQKTFWEEPSSTLNSSTAPNLSVETPTPAAVLPGTFPEDGMFTAKDAEKGSAEHPISGEWPDSPEPNLIDTVKDVAFSAKQQLEAAAGSLYERARKLSQDFSASPIAEGSNTSETARSTVTEPDATYASNYGTAYQAAVSGTEQFLKSAIDKGSELTKAVGSKATEIIEEAKPLGQKLSNTMTGSSESNLSNMEESTSGQTPRSIGESAGSAMTETYRATSSALSNTYTSAASTTSAALSNVEDLAATSIETAVDGVKHAGAVTREAAVATVVAAAAAAQSAKENAMNKIFPSNESVPTISQRGTELPEYIEGIMPAEATPQEEVPMEDIIAATEEERRRRNQPGSTGRQALAHAHQEALAFAEGMRQHLGESSDIPALSVPRRNRIHDAEEEERLEREEAADSQKALGETQAKVIMEALHGNDTSAPLSIARREAIKSEEEKERDLRIKESSQNKEKSLLLASVLTEGLHNEHTPAAEKAKKTMTSEMEEKEREDRTSLPLRDGMERSEFVASLVCAGISGDSAQRSDAAFVARNQRLRDLVEDERDERVKDESVLAPLAHSQADAVREAVATGVSLNHVHNTPDMVKAFHEMEEAERKDRMLDVSDKVGKERSPSATAFATGVMEAMTQPHSTSVVDVATREVLKMQEDIERDRRIAEQDAHQTSTTAAIIRNGMLQPESNDAVDVARNNAQRNEGLSIQATQGTNSNSISTFNESKGQADPAIVPSTIPVQTWGAEGKPDSIPLSQRVPHLEGSIADGKVTPPSTPIAGNEREVPILDARAVAEELKHPHRSATPDSSQVGLETIRPKPSDDNNSIGQTSGSNSLSVPKAEERRASEDSGSSSGGTRYNQEKPSKAHASLNKTIGRVETALGKILKKPSMVSAGTDRLDAGQEEAALAKRLSVSSKHEE